MNNSSHASAELGNARATDAEAASALGVPRRTKPLWRRYPKTLALAVVLLALGGWWKFKQATKKPPEPPSAAVALADITQTVQAAGVLQARTKVDVGAQVSGQVQTLHVELGQQVKKGDALVSLDPEIARTTLAQAQASVAQQQALIERLRVDMESAQRELARQKRLMAAQATAGQELENAQSQVDRLAADFKGQQATLQRLQADLAKAQVNLGYTRITAPIDGTVVNIPVQQGQTVIAVQITPVMVSLAQMDVITVRARVPEADVYAVKVGQVAKFSTLSGQGKKYEGRVRVIQPVPERMGNAVFYSVLFDVDNKDRTLLSDMTVQVNIETGAAKQVPTLPMVALGERDADGFYKVQVLGADGKKAERKVRIGLQDSGKAQVIEGVKVGEKLVLAPEAQADAKGGATVTVN
jgi:macrolide-specific efflux system membrane fusion protein